MAHQYTSEALNKTKNIYFENEKLCKQNADVEDCDRPYYSQNKEHSNDLEKLNVESVNFEILHILDGIIWINEEKL